MAATVDVQEANGAGPTWNTVTSARFCTDDAYNPGSSNPIPISDSVVRYSYWKHWALYISAGTFTQISNIRIYCDGSIDWTFGSTGELRIGLRDSGDNGCPSGSYDQADGTVGTTGYDMENATNGHAYYKGQTTPSGDIESYTSGSPLTLDSNTYTSVTDRTYAAVCQVKVDTDATQGAQGTETLTFVYDEI